MQSPVALHSTIHSTIHLAHYYNQHNQASPNTHLATNPTNTRTPDPYFFCTSDSMPSVSGSLSITTESKRSR